MMCMQHHKKEESEGCENVPAMGWLRSDERAVSVVLSIPIYECLGCAWRQLANALERELTPRDGRVEVAHPAGDAA